MKKILLTALALVLGATVSVKAQDNDVTVLLDTDFSVFAEGSIQSPVSIPYSSSFTSKVSGYSFVSKLSQAGGCILIGSGGYIQTNSLSAAGYTFPTGGATVRITAEIKMGDSYGGAIQFTPGSSNPVSLAVEGDEWTTVQAIVSGVTSTTKIKVAPYLSVSGLYIKSLKIEVSPNFIASPVAYLPTDANGTSFTASCSTVTGAASYEADVFSLDAQGNPVYFKQNVELKKLTAYSTSATAKITELDPDVTYYYVARAVLANGAKSENSDVIEVVRCISSLDAPVANVATNVSEIGFTANWGAVANAKYYMLNLFQSIKLDADTYVPVFEEDFEGVTVGTVASIEFSGDLNSFTKVQGWENDFSKAYAKGYYVIYPTSSGYVTTPTIDLSMDEGKFDFVVNAAVGAFGTFNTSDNTIVAELLEGDNVVETSEAKTFESNKFTDYTFSFTKGTATSRVKLTYTIVSGSSYKLYIDDIKFVQTVKAGNVYKKQLSSIAVEEVTSYNVKIDSPVAGASYSYTVNAVGETVVGSGSSAQVGEISSNASNEIVVSLSAGVDNVSMENTPKAWKVADGVINVLGNHVTVCDLQGRIIYSDNIAGAATIETTAHGIVIVNIDGKSFKIVL